jgi:hypothetical protein
VSEVWNSEVQKDVREALIRGQMHQKCTALHCPFKYKAGVPVSDLEAKALKNKFPTALEINMPNTWCNIGGPIPTKENPACIMCPRATHRFDPDDPAKFFTILEKCRPLMPYLNNIVVVGAGEVFWNNNLWTVLDILGFEKYRDKIKISVFSNGTLLNDEKRRRFIESCPVFDLNISVDAAKAETYKLIRRRDFHTLLKNIKDVAYDQNRDRKNQLLHLMYNINLLNVDEVEDMVLMWKGWPINTVLFTHTHNLWADADSIVNEIVVNENNYKRFVRARDTINRVKKEVDFQVVIYNPLEKDYEKKAKERPLKIL